MSTVKMGSFSNCDYSVWQNAWEKPQGKSKYRFKKAPLNGQQEQGMQVLT